MSTADPREVIEVQAAERESAEANLLRTSRRVEERAERRTFRGTAGRLAYKVGSARGLDDTDRDREIMPTLAELEAAKGTRESRASRVKWWMLRAAARRLQPFPLSQEKLRLAAALLRRGGYRTAPGYLYAVKRRHVELGHPWPDVMALTLRDAVRATTRGLGPSAQAVPVCFASVARLAADGVTVEVGGTGPRRPVDCLLVATWWMLREIELGTASVDQITFLVGGGGCGKADFHLPISKSDARALGKHRALSCTCPSACCPVAAARRLVNAATPRTEGATPLAQTAGGAPVAKEAIIKALRAVAAAAGQPNTLEVTGHSPRVTVAQLLAAAGIPMERIAAFGRWGSSAVRLYVREANRHVLFGGLAEHVSKKVLEAPGGGTRTSTTTALPTHDPHTPDPPTSRRGRTDLFVRNRRRGGNSKVGRVRGRGVEAVDRIGQRPRERTRHPRKASRDTLRR